MPRTDYFAGFLDLGVNPWHVHFDLFDLAVGKYSPTCGDRTQMSAPIHHASCPRPISHVLLVLPTKCGCQLPQRSATRRSEPPGTTTNMNGQLAPRPRRCGRPGPPVMGFSCQSFLDNCFLQIGIGN